MWSHSVLNYLLSTTETLGQDANTFRATIKTREWCNSEPFWYVYLYVWTDVTLFFLFFFFKFVLLILNIKLQDEIKQTLARSNFYTIEDQLEVVFEIATHRHCKFSVIKRVCSFIKKRLQRKCFLWILRNFSPILKNISEQLLPPQ